MTKRYFEYYQYIVPAVLSPLSLYLWWETYSGHLSLVLFAWALPIFWGYIVPAVGTNYRLGRFRIHHGFVFGSATSTLTWICHAHAMLTVLQAFHFGFILASVLGFWNILYDTKAIESGLLKVYNTPWADEKSPEAITMDYAPWFFAGFGFVFGLSLGLVEISVLQFNINMLEVIIMFIATLIMAILLPVLGYRLKSFKKHGHSGCAPIQKTT